MVGTAFLFLLWRCLTIFDVGQLMSAYDTIRLYRKRVNLLREFSFEHLLRQ